MLFLGHDREKPKDMWLFAAEVESADLLLAAMPGGSPRRPEERVWLTLAEFEVVGRPDQHYILRDIEAKLIAYFERNMLSRPSSAIRNSPTRWSVRPART